MSTVVVAIEPGETGPGHDAVTLGAGLARRWKASLLLVTVVDPQGTGGAADVAERLTALQNIYGVDSALCDGVPVGFRVAAGSSPARVLHEIAEEIQPLCLVVGSARSGRAGRVLPGSVGERLLHGAPCPVAVAPRGFAAGHPRGARLDTIGVAYVRTADGHAALQYGATLADLAGGRLRVFTVLPSVWSIAKEAVAALEHEIAAIPEGAAPDHTILRGDVVDELAAASREVDVLVVGSRGYGPLRSVLLGGVSGRVIREAYCPVIVAPRAPAETWSAAYAASASSGV